VRINDTNTSQLVSRSDYELTHATSYDDLLNLQVHRLLYGQKMDMDKLMGMVKTMMDNQAKADANNKAMLAEMQEMKAMHKKMMARMDAWLMDTNDNREETTACQETMEARLEVEEPASVDMTPEVADEEVPSKNAEVMAAGGPKKRRRDRRHLAAGRRQKKQQDLVAARRGTTRRAAVARRRRILFTKDTTRKLHGPRKRLVAARRGTTRRAKVAWQKRNQRLYESQNKKKPAAERRSRPTAGANAAQPLKVNGSASWSVFRRQIVTIEQKQWSHREKSMCLVTSPKR
jgi:hypothetical protein